MSEEPIPENMSINQLCKLIGVSRSRYYQLLDDKFLLPPIYSLESKRPYYTREMAEKNMSVIKNNKGLNGKVCLFYTTARRAGIKPSKSANNQKLNKQTPHQDLIGGLVCLGLSDVKPAQIDAVLKNIYPQGVQNIDEGEVLKTVYRAIVKQNSQDNVNR